MATLKTTLVAAAATILVGCATVSDPGDPYEPFNRGVYRFNDGLDRAAVQPAANSSEPGMSEPVEIRRVQRWLRRLAK